MKRYLFRRLVRRAIGEPRPPVHQPTERELQFTDITLAFTAGACSMAVVVLFLITYLWRPVCG